MGKQVLSDTVGGSVNRNSLFGGQFGKFYQNLKCSNPFKNQAVSLVGFFCREKNSIWAQSSMCSDGHLSFIFNRKISETLKCLSADQGENSVGLTLLCHPIQQLKRMASFTDEEFFRHVFEWGKKKNAMCLFYVTKDTFFCMCICKDRLESLRIYIYIKLMTVEKENGKNTKEGR